MRTLSVTSLLCVRYRFDDLTRERVKTVELIVQRRSGEPASARPPVPEGRAPGRPHRRLTSARRGRTPRSRERCPPAAEHGGAEGRSPHPLGRDGSAPADQVRRRLVGPAPPALASPPRPRRTRRSPSPGSGGSRWVDVDTAWLDVDTARGGSYEHGVDRSGHGWAGLETACR